MALTTTPPAELPASSLRQPPNQQRHRLLAALFTATGFAALTLQVVWQRLISLHSGVDLASTTTVVAAFLAGLGLGSLAAGRLADRLGPRSSLLVFAGANVAIAAIASVSTWLFYDLYEAAAPSLGSPWASFAFNAAMVVVPTALMGLSLPLLTKGVVQSLDNAGAVVGRLYALNTVGAAAGAAVTGWLLLGNLGFVTVTRLAGLIYLLVGAAVLFIVGSFRPEAVSAQPPVDTGLATGAGSGSGPEPGAGPHRGGAIWPWVLAYAGTGAIALGLEQVFFRLVDAVMRSNSYSFAHVLSLYLALFGIGAAVGSRLVRRGLDPRRGFLLMQGVVAASALAGLVVLTRVLPAVGLGGPMADYFGTDGFNVGFTQLSSARGFAAFLFAYLGVPLLLMAVPVLAAGASYPCIQATVSDRFEQLGRRTGTLLFANVVGNVVGTLLSGFVLIDWLGTAGTLRLLGAVLGAGVALAALSGADRRHLGAGSRFGGVRVGARVGATALLGVGLVVAVPSNHQLWAQLHGVGTDQLWLEEQRSCTVTLKAKETGSDILHINASSQNGYPFDDFHVLIGLVPTLVHPTPRRALAIGLGIGATAYAMTSEPRVERIDTVELCGGQYPLLRRLAADHAPELRRFFADPRVVTKVGDGRKFLLVESNRYDVVTVDTLRPQSGYSGSLYSVEFYRLVADRLAAGGILAQWVPTTRVLNSVTAVFPHVVTFGVATYGGSGFMLASQEPLPLDPVVIRQRFEAIAAEAYTPGQRAALQGFVANLVPTCVANGSLTVAPNELVNRDLFPRDEYFLNNDLDVAAMSACR